MYKIYITFTRNFKAYNLKLDQKNQAALHKALSTSLWVSSDRNDIVNHNHIILKELRTLSGIYFLVRYLMCCCGGYKIRYRRLCVLTLSECLRVQSAGEVRTRIFEAVEFGILML